MSRDETAVAISQAELNEANRVLIDLIEQYKGGLISIVEFVNEVSFQKSRVENINLTGLIDPNTGLQYPTLEELKAFEAQWDSIPMDSIPIH